MVTLAVTAADAEKVVYAAEHGTIWLSNEPTDAVATGTSSRHRKEREPMTLAILRDCVRGAADSGYDP